MRVVDGVDLNLPTNTAYHRYSFVVAFYGASATVISWNGAEGILLSGCPCMCDHIL